MYGKILCVSVCLCLMPVLGYADDLTIDNSQTIGMRSPGTTGSGTGGLLDFRSWLAAARKGGDAYNSSGGAGAMFDMQNGAGFNGFLGYFLMEDPKDLNGYIKEYQENNGGPISSKLGMSAFAIQNSIVKTFMGLLLLIFVGAAVFAGLNKAATGGGDFNYLNLVMKFMIGLIVVFHPNYIYGACRVVQVGALYALHAAAGAMKGSDTYTLLKNGDLLSQGTVMLRNTAITNKMGELTVPYAATTKTAGQQKQAISAFNVAAKKTDPVTPHLDPASMSDSELRALATTNYRQHFSQVVSGDPDFMAGYEQAKTKYMKALSDGTDLYQAQTDCVQELEQLADAAARKAYNIPEPDILAKMADITLGAISAVAGWQYTIINSIAKFLSNFIGAFVIPLCVWILLVFSSLILELTVVVVVITYPLWFLEATKKAFLGAWNGLVGCALIPCVGAILLTIFEGVMAVITTALMYAFLMPVAGVAILVTWLLIWIIGAMAITWKVPKVTKAIMEGGGFIGQLLAAGLTAGITGALAGIGVAASVASLGVDPTGTLGKGIKSTTDAASNAVKKAGDEAGGGSGGGSGGSGSGSSAAGGSGDQQMELGLGDVKGAGLPQEAAGGKGAESTAGRINERKGIPKEKATAKGSGKGGIADSIASAANKAGSGIATGVTKAGQSGDSHPDVTGTGGNAAQISETPTSDTEKKQGEGEASGATGASTAGGGSPGGAKLSRGPRIIKSGGFKIGQKGGIVGAFGQKDDSGHVVSGGHGLLGHVQARAHNLGVLVSGSSHGNAVLKTVGKTLLKGVGHGVMYAGDPGKVAMVQTAESLRNMMVNQNSPGKKANDLF